jgi:IS5 family transposase
MSRRRTRREVLGLIPDQRGRRSSLDQMGGLIDWVPVENCLDGIHAAARGEPAWPPLALFKAMLIAVWHDLSDVKLAKALDDR